MGARHQPHREWMFVMTRNSAIKTAVRERMERTGQTYAEARRDLTHGTEPSRRPLPEPGYAIQMDRTASGALPYPAYVTGTGYMFNAVHDYGWIIGFEVADSPTRTVALGWTEFTKNPAAAVGMVPVTRDPFTDVWSSWTTPVRTIEALPTEPAMDGGRGPRVMEMQARHVLNDTVALSLSSGARWEVSGPGLVEDVNGEDRPFAAIGEFVRADGSIVPWGVFLHDPVQAVGCSVTLWDTTGAQRAGAVLVTEVEAH